MKYSQERKPSTEFRPKQAVLAKLALPHQRTVKDVAAEEGISPATLYHWRQQARLNGGLFPDDGADPEGWTGAVWTSPCLRNWRAASVVPPDDAQALAQALAKAPEDGPGRNRIPLPEVDRNLLSWTAYGARYRQELLSAVACRA